MAVNLFHLPHSFPLYPNNIRSHRQPPPALSRLVRCSVSTQQIVHPSDERRSANYQPTIWSHDFMQSLKNVNADEMYKDRARKLEEEVRCMINNENEEMLNELELIDDIQRLGLTNRFQKDIKNVLDKYLAGCNVTAEKSLHATALYFRLLRQNNYEVSQDVFKDFLDYKGDILACHHNDTRGIRSFYEASYLAHEEDDLLDRSMAQTSTHLKNFVQNRESNTAEFVSHAIDLPLHHRMLMLEARWHIEEYAKRKDANRALLQLAKMEFNMAQSVLQRDLREMSRWWSDLGLAHNLSFSRDRLMECFFWTVGMVFEPKFSHCRKGLTKVTSFITTIDDVYDVYGTLDELELFTDAVDRWDVNAVRNLPDYMKLCFLALYNAINEMGYDTLKEHGQNAIPYLSRAWADLCKAFLQEAKWSYKKSSPTFDEYIENAWRSVSGTVILVHTYFLLGQDISKQALDSLMNYHELVHLPSIIFRLCNDLGASSAELARGETINSISCYMNENGVSEEQAREHIKSLIDKAWKKLNKARNCRTPFGKAFAEAAINLARISQCTYQHGDSHGAPDSRAKDRVLSLIVEPVSVLE